MQAKTPRLEFSLILVTNMGVSGLLSLKWMDINGQWHPWNGPSSQHVDQPYNLFPVAPDTNNNIQVSGNNGNPVPPGAPCP